MDDSSNTIAREHLRTRLDQLLQPQTARDTPAALARKLANRSRMLRGRMGQAKSIGLPLKFLAFHKSGERYGVPIDDVLEVLQLEQFTVIPHTPTFIPGVIHWRGAILALFDPGRFFGVAESGIADKHACIIVEAARRQIALITGEVDDIYSVPRDQIKPAPKLPGGISPDWLLGVHDGNRMILKLDLILQDSRLDSWKT